MPLAAALFRKPYAAPQLVLSLPIASCACCLQDMAVASVGDVQFMPGEVLAKNPKLTKLCTELLFSKAQAEARFCLQLGGKNKSISLFLNCLQPGRAIGP